MMAAELAGPHSRYVVDVEPEGERERIVGYGGVRALQGSADADIRPSPSTPAIADPAAAGRCCRRCSPRPQERGATRCSSRCAPTTRSPRACTPRGFRGDRPPPRLLPAGRRRRDRHAPRRPDAGATTAERPTTACRASRSCSASRPSCDETGIGIVRGRTLLVQHDRLQHGRARPLRRRRARGRRPRAPGGAAARPRRRRSPRPASRLEDLDAIAVTSGPGLAGALMVGVGAAKALAVSLGKPLYAVNHLVGHVGADLLHARGGPGSRSSCRRSRCWSRAATPRCCSCATSSPTSNCSARPSTTPRARPSTRSPGCSACRTPAARRSTGPPRRRPDRDPVPARALTEPKDLEKHRYDFSFSGLKTAVARWVERGRTRASEMPVADVAASFREAVVDVLITKAIAACADRGVPRLLLGGGVVANAPGAPGRAGAGGGGGRDPAHPAAVALHRQRRDDRGARRRAASRRVAGRATARRSAPTRRCRSPRSRSAEPSRTGPPLTPPAALPALAAAPDDGS